MMNYIFVESKQLCKLDIEQVELNRVIERYYTTHLSTIYVTEKMEPDHLIGIITLGDVLRYRKYGASIVNTEFTCISKIDDEDINRIYKEKRTICQLPVISDGILVGAVLFKDREENTGIEDGFNRICKSFYYQKQLEYISQSIVDIGAYMICFVYPDAENGVLSEDDIIRLGNKKKNNKDGQLGRLKENEQALFFGDEYYEGIGEDFQSDYDRISVYYDNGIAKFHDLAGRFINIQNGKRTTSNNPSKEKPKVFIVGACFVFGAYVSDDRTIPYYLQERINKEINGDYQVINCGNMGIADFAPIFCENISTNDIVVVMAAHPELVLAIKNAKMPDSCSYHVLNSVFQFEHFSVDYLFNSVTHHNYQVNRCIADFIYEKILEAGLLGKSKRIVRKTAQNYYIDGEAYLYFKKLILAYDLQVYIEKGHNGAIVMNCNPFTEGHRFLVEKSLEYVEHLYIFVVEEDASFFSFAERFEMVKCGLHDLVKVGRVTVIPSGNYIISKETFSQYFEKEKDIEIINSMEFDVRIFAEIVCKALNISTRFVGEEPTDKITDAYNKTMKRIFPLYDIKLVEFERLSKGDGSVVSATKVREWLCNGEWENIKKVVPKSTYEILRNKFW